MVCQARIQDFLKGGGDGQGGPLRGGGVIAPVGEKFLFEHTKFSATRGGDHPYHHPPMDLPLSVNAEVTVLSHSRNSVLDSYIRKKRETLSKTEKKKFTSKN